MKTRLVYLQSGFLKKVRNNISIKEEKYGFTLSKLYEMMSYTIDTSICTDMTLAEIEDDELLGPLSCETYCSNFEIKPDSKDIIENALTSTEENIEDLKQIQYEHDGDSEVYISEPIDRDRAYRLNFNAELFKGDL